MRWIKVAASLLMLMLMSFLTTISPLLSQSSLSHNLDRKTAEEIYNQATQNPPIELAQNSGGGRIRVVYHEGTDERSRQTINRFRESGVFDREAETIRNTFYLPHNLTISFQSCGQANAFYNPIAREIVMCIDLFWNTFNLFEENNFAERISNEKSKISDGEGAGIVFLFVLYHELGHALIDILNLPVVGKEEDAVDQFSSVVILSNSSNTQELKNKLLASTVAWFLWSAERRGDQQPAYWGQHALEEQRMYNIMCLWYGNNPEGVGSAGIANYLRGRIRQCPGEYESIKAAWLRLLEPHARNRNSSSGSSTNNNSGQNTNPSEPNRVW